MISPPIHQPSDETHETISVKYAAVYLRGAHRLGLDVHQALPQHGITPSLMQISMAHIPVSDFARHLRNLSFQMRDEFLGLGRTLHLLQHDRISVPLVSGLNPKLSGMCGRPRPGVEARLVDQNDCEVGRARRAS